MKIRQAEERDLDAIRAILTWEIENRHANFNLEPPTPEEARTEWVDTHERYPWLVADDGAEILGFAKASVYKGRCAYDWTPETTVYVVPTHHGKGIGRTLYSRLLDLLREQGYGSAVGAIALPNDASEGLHRTLGFELVGVLKRAGWKRDRWHDIAYWQCFLQAEDWEPGAIQTVGEAALRLPSENRQDQ